MSFRRAEATTVITSTDEEKEKSIPSKTAPACRTVKILVLPPVNGGNIEESLIKTEINARNVGYVINIKIGKAALFVIREEKAIEFPRAQKQAGLSEKWKPTRRWHSFRVHDLPSEVSATEVGEIIQQQLGKKTSKVDFGKYRDPWKKIKKNGNGEM